MTRDRWPVQDVDSHYLLFDILTCNMENDNVISQVTDRHTCIQNKHLHWSVQPEMMTAFIRSSPGKCPRSPLRVVYSSRCLTLASSTMYAAVVVRMSCRSLGLNPFLSYLTTGTLYCGWRERGMKREGESEVEMDHKTSGSYRKKNSSFCFGHEFWLLWYTQNHSNNVSYLDSFVANHLQYFHVNVLFTWKENMVW